MHAKVLHNCVQNLTGRALSVAKKSTVFARCMRSLTGRAESVAANVRNLCRMSADSYRKSAACCREGAQSSQNACCLTGEKLCNTAG